MINYRIIVDYPNGAFNLNDEGVYKIQKLVRKKLWFFEYDKFITMKTISINTDRNGFMVDRNKALLAMIELTQGELR